VVRIAEDPTQRLVVAVVGDDPVGVAHLRQAPVSPIHGEDAVHVGYLHVRSEFRRRGLGKQMMETAADWAEDLGSQHIVASVAATARESNRFLARLGLSQVAVVRATTVTALKGKLRPSIGQTVVPNVVTARRLRRLNGSRGPAGR
jgi:GNAT superfamily N-acetyltransferase